uniref:Tetratricopeptide repeat protein 30 n=1 Tax=Mastacembelus armatus TaxID=205130 RepID=A0A7N8X6G5_9TELE
MTAIKDGEYTATIYKLIKDSQYVEAIHILNGQLQKHTKSRAALSLLGYCYYHIQDFTNAAECYEQLTQLHPDVEEYKVYYAQSLYKAGAYPEATKASFILDNPGSHTKVQHKHTSLLEQLPQDDPDYVYNMGCLLYQDGKYEEACKKFMSAMQVLGYVPALSYNIALCYYSLMNYNQALKYIEKIIERGIREHPELSVGMTTEGIDVHSVGNTLVLHQTALIEAFNLKAAVEYQLKNLKGAQEALTDMPPRSEEELDPVTLHNQALLNMDTKPSEGFEKLAFLLQQPSFPPVTFGNLLLLYCKHEYFDLAADVLAENAHLTYKFLAPVTWPIICDLYIFCCFLYFSYALLTCQTAPEEAKIYWNRENFQMVEKIFRKSVEVCNEDDTWKLNVAHVLFMQNKYKEAIGFYEPIVKKHYDNILNVSAVVLANLCVSYIMTSQNEEAEELMRKIEKEEEQISYDDPDKKVFHLCIVNLVIGTLYCAKGNYDFGISRVIKSLEPYNKKLGTDTWFYAKRCFLSLLENMSKHMVMLRDAVVQECIQFLEHCEVYGKEVPAIIEQPLEDIRIHIGKNTVTYEARLLKALFYEVIGWNK